MIDHVSLLFKIALGGARLRTGLERETKDRDSYIKPSTKGSKNINYRHATFTGLVSKLTTIAFVSAVAHAGP